MKPSKMGLVGLGKMGSQIAHKLLDVNFELVVDSKNAGNTMPLVDRGASSFEDYQDLISQLGDKPIIWLMIPHQAVPVEIDKLLEVVPEDGVIIDGGNSRYTSTIEQGEKCLKRKVSLIDVGTSGGVWGEKVGFSMMVGGDEQAVEHISPLLDALAQPEAGWYRLGRTGAGHFVKMVHNGVEYGIMESYAEGYRVMGECPFEDIDLSKVAEVWQKQSINRSFLNQLIEQMLKEDPNFDGVEGVVHESGEARWTLETAKELGIEMPAIQASFDVRLDSQKGKTNYATKFLARLRNAFGGHDINQK